MASHQVGGTPVEDVITETEAIKSKEAPQVAAPPPLPPVEPVHTMDVEDEAEGLEELTATPYEAEKIDTTFSDDHDEEKDNEYSSFMEREDDAAATFRPTGDPATFGEFDDEDDDPEDEDET